MKNQDMKIDTAKLKSKRQAKGWTQQHLADISGISLRTIQRAEMNGSVSTETISALNVVFKMEHFDWLASTEPDFNRSQVIHRGWKIALISIALTQVVVLLITWMLVGEISTLWLKLLTGFWLVLGLITVISWITFKVQKVKSHRELSDLKQKFNDTKPQ
jgi:transcriptional regulator with XRE-family HTH domain